MILQFSNYFILKQICVLTILYNNFVLCEQWIHSQKRMAKVHNFQEVARHNNTDDYWQGIIMGRLVHLTQWLFDLLVIFS